MFSSFAKIIEQVNISELIPQLKKAVEEYLEKDFKSSEEPWIGSGQVGKRRALIFQKLLAKQDLSKEFILSLLSALFMASRGQLAINVYNKVSPFLQQYIDQVLIERYISMHRQAGSFYLTSNYNISTEAKMIEFYRNCNSYVKNKGCDVEKLINLSDILVKPKIPNQSPNEDEFINKQSRVLEEQINNSYSEMELAEFHPANRDNKSVRK